ncbi:MAG: acetate/propionate family kinase [Pseudomonadota bacterium]|nr:acetate/propionate family kinase [Pseudomonadota bacterium]
MTPVGPQLLVINAGSSSIKFALHATAASLRCTRRGSIDRIGAGQATLTVTDATSTQPTSCAVDATDHAAATRALIAWLEQQDGWPEVVGIGHRVVQGMARVEPERVTQALLDDLHRIEPYAPDHLPAEIALIEDLRARWPLLPQVACFDTAFHAHMPRVATRLPMPRRYDLQGVRRYGFHGLSYAYLMTELTRSAGAAAAAGRIVLAHLGNGASMAAVHRGRSIDTSMGFTPTSGLPMSTRSGDLDPGIAAFLERSEAMTAQQFYTMVNKESGLRGISETSADMRDLLACEADDLRAAEAIAVFCYQAKKCVGAYAAALGGLDTLVFAGGIGENAAPVRARICTGLDFLGIALDDTRNAAHAAVISAPHAKVTVRVIRTDEALMIARSVSRVLGLDEA